MNTQVLTRQANSVSEFKKNPSKSVANAKGEAVAVLNHNKVDFYAVPAELFARMTEVIEDWNDGMIAKARAEEPMIMKDLDDL
ncbi:MAG: hypothetical protein HEP70_16900 [Rhodobiaceae bacterium]|jgi:antitoxin StbD|nr:hypothetical protein [Rhodobiaceae bacterium]